MKTLTRIAVIALWCVSCLYSQTFIRDTVICEPANPTNADNITFKLFNIQNCCVTDFYKNAIQISDTVIYLSYEYDDSACALAMCLVPGAWTSFKSGPIKAGKYAVYKVGNIYCPPPRICPEFVTIPKFVGTLVVEKSTKAASHASSARQFQGPTLSIHGNDIQISIGKTQHGIVQAFDLKGTLLGIIYKGYLLEGDSHFSLNQGITLKHSGKAVIIKLATENSTASRLLFLNN